MTSLSDSPPTNRLAAIARPTLVGHVARIGQAEAVVAGLPLGLGDLVEVGPDQTLAEVVSIDGMEATVLPYGDFRGIRSGDVAKPHIGSESDDDVRAGQLYVPVGQALLGRVLDGLGRPLDGGPSIADLPQVPIHNVAPSALSRPPVVEPMPVGIRAIDTLLTCGRGQRIAIMAGSGVGKSSLLSMLVRGSEADVNVLCLVGERGREVREFLDNDLGPEGRARSVVVVATSDEPALVRRTAASVATRIAEGFRDGGAHVNLLMDSVTRFAIAQREIGLAAGEMPTSRGFPPSALSLLPGLLERAGTSASGSITGFYTVLVEGDDMNDPVGDTVRSIVDGHLVLSRELANAGHFPSIDVLASASRVAKAVTTEGQQTLAAKARRLLAVFERGRDLIEVGAYSPGSDPELDWAIEIAPALEAFRRQDLRESTPAGQAWAVLDTLLGQTDPSSSAPPQSGPAQSGPGQPGSSQAGPGQDASGPFAGFGSGAGSVGLGSADLLGGRR